MKIKLLFTCLIISAVSLAQTTQMEVFKTGTKFVFYPNQCGNAIPEAQGKITFCDGNNSLGIVDRSYGLNGNVVSRMLPNYFNEDEVYVTDGGLSIRKTSGAWENIPNEALPSTSDQSSWSNDVIIRDGIVLPDGKIVIRSINGNIGPIIHMYDPILKSFEIIGFPSNRFPYTLTYDQDRDIVWFIAYAGGVSGRYLYAYDGTDLTFVESIPSIGGNTVSETFVYKDDMLWMGNTSGLHKIDITDYENSGVTITTYNSSSTPGLPFNFVSGFQFDTNGNLWLSQSGNFDGGIVEFNIANETHELYQLERTASTNYSFNSIAMDGMGTIWLTASNYSGVTKLTFSGNTTNWEQLSTTDLTALNVSILTTPDEVYFMNNRFYFMGMDQSEFEVIINEDDFWYGRSDDEVGNISYEMAQRFSTNLPDENGGMWWLNPLDNIMIYRGADDEHLKLNLTNLFGAGAVDTDQKPIIAVSPGKIVKADLPVTYELFPESFQNARGLKRYKDEIWWFSDSNLELKILKYNQDIATFNLDNSYQSTFNFDVDSYGDAWFAKNQGSELILKHFNVQTEVTTDYTNPLMGSLRSVVAGPNGTMWFVGQSGLIFYDGTNFTTYLNSNYTELYNNVSLITDENGVAYVLQNDPAAITKIENAGTPQEVFSFTYLEGNNSILPAFEHYRPSDLSIDSEGAIWTHASLNTFKIEDNDTAKEYREEGESYTVSGLIYNDINQNDSYDQGEEYPGQVVTLKINDEIYTTFTNNAGIYNFFLYEENADYEITLPTISPFVTATNRRLLVNVGQANQNYANNDFQLNPRFVNSLLVKSGAKVGAWGFVRDNFENTFTTAIGNISTTETYTNVELNYVFENEDENSANVLPNIQEVNVYELDPNGSVQIIEKVNIDPVSNKWSVGLDSNAFAQTQLNVTPVIVQNDGQINVGTVLLEVSPLNTYILEIKTDLFDPVSNGDVISFGLISVESTDFRDSAGNLYPQTVILSPLEDRDDSISDYPSNFPETPYLDPEEVYSDPPYLNPRQVYSDPPYKSPIYSSYDPNDKLVDEGVVTEINDRHIGRKWLTYTVRFENTGNFSAKDVVITDELDENLDPNSVMVLEASHDYTVEVLRSGEDISILKFSFNDIFLPFDDANNDGFIKFRVKAKGDIAENTIVENNAFIYFDQNPPIITNVVQVRFLTIESLSTTDEVIDAEFSIYPNPANTVINIESEIDIERIELFTILGKKLMQTNERKLNVSQFNSGTYIIRIVSNQGTLSKKLIIR